MTDTLYKRTTTGAVQIWRQEFNDAGDGYRTVSGQMNGAHVTSEWTLPAGKNIGRSNATTPREQAEAEVLANYTKKLAQGGYVRHLSDIDQDGYFKPMLAKGYEDYPITNFGDGYYSQPKLDGLRCIARRDGLWTRQGKPILTCSHFMRDLEPLFVHFGEGAVFDGEVYSDRLADDFNTLVSIAKKVKPTRADLDRAEAQLQYHIYDIALPGLSFGNRMSSLSRGFAACGAGKSLMLVETTPVESLDQMDALYASYLERGMEGQMIRKGDSLYQNKRTKDLLKRKEFTDAEYDVVSVHEGMGNRSGMAGYVTCRLPDGRTFRATPKGTNAHRVGMLENADKLIGCQATVQHFKPTPDGIPRFPVLKIIHTTERW